MNTWTDNGPGVPAYQLRVVFDAYGRPLGSIYEPLSREGAAMLRPPPPRSNGCGLLAALFLLLWGGHHGGR